MTALTRKEPHPTEMDSRLGFATWNDTETLTVTDAMVVARRRRTGGTTGPEESGILGYELRGQVHLVPFSDEGLLVDVIDVQLYQGPDHVAHTLSDVLVHEFAHVFLEHAELPPWAHEGLPEVLAWSYDKDANSFGMMDGLITRVGAWIDDAEPIWDRVRRPGAPSPVETSVATSNSEPLRALYLASPYLISQAIASQHAADDDAFWSAVRSTLQRVGSSSAQSDSPVAVPADADWQTLLGTVYTERIQYPPLTGHIGEPLLSMQDISLPGGATATLSVKQVQHELLSTQQGVPFSPFTGIPYALGCSVLNASNVASSSDKAFDECHTTAKGPGTGPLNIAVLNGIVDQYYLNAAPGVDVSLGDVPVPNSTQAVAFTLFAHHLLFPNQQAKFLRQEAVPSALMASLPEGDGSGPLYNSQNKHKLPSNTKYVVTLEGRSGVEAVPGWLDGDGDGFAAPADCNDLDPNIFPGNSAWPTDGSGAYQRWLSTNTPSFGQRVDEIPENVDLDCDGWPLDFWRMVEATR